MLERQWVLNELVGEKNFVGVSVLVVEERLLVGDEKVRVYVHVGY